MNGGPVFHDWELALRENWLVRNNKWIEKCAEESETAYVFTWKVGIPDDPLASRLGGAAPVREGFSWPLCTDCETPLLYAGTLDFRATPMREDVPGDALTLHYCVDCDDDTHLQFTWLRSGDSVKLLSRDTDSSHKRVYKATIWTITEYDFRPEQLQQMDDFSGEELLGNMPYYHYAVFASKIGGFRSAHETAPQPACDCGNPMRYIAQFTPYGEIYFPGEILPVFVCAELKCERTSVAV